jgi:hypothetical protein
MEIGALISIEIDTGPELRAPQRKGGERGSQVVLFGAGLVRCHLGGEDLGVVLWPVAELFGLG